MRVVLSKEFMSRLDDLRDYLLSELMNENSADDVINGMLDNLSILESFPLAGVNLNVGIIQSKEHATS